MAVGKVRRQTSKVGAGCGKAARPVLCGGRSVMSVPTAIDFDVMGLMRQQQRKRRLVGQRSTEGRLLTPRPDQGNECARLRRLACAHPRFWTRSSMNGRRV